MKVRFDDTLDVAQNTINEIELLIKQKDLNLQQIFEQVDTDKSDTICYPEF